MVRFKRYIGIDYSGAATPTSGMKGLRVYLATEKRVLLKYCHLLVAVSTGVGKGSHCG